MRRAKPAKIHQDAIPWTGPEQAPTKVRIRRLVTRGRHGSELMLSVCEMAPGEETNRWSSMPENDAGPGEHWFGPVDETYHCIRGRLTLSWDESQIDFGAGDAVYLAPGWHYHLKNSGDEAAFFVYHMHPAPE